MTIDHEMTILTIAILVFFVGPIGIVLSALIADHRARSNGPSIVQWTNDQSKPRQ